MRENFWPGLKGLWDFFLDKDVGTAWRQGAVEVSQYEIMPKPPETRAADNPWPPVATDFKNLFQP
jgi:hypothetical protein